MVHRGGLLLGFVVLALVALLACPAGAATPAAKGSHYPGQKCIKCHKSHGKRGEMVPGGTATETGTGGTQTPATAPKGAPAAK